MSLRNSDTSAENAVAGFLDRYFYPRYTRNVTRYTDYDTQMSGVDVRFDYDQLTNMLVDEKTVAHYVNKDIPTFAFEVNFLLRNGEVVEGWFFDEAKRTQYYLLSWIWASRERGFTTDDIKKLDILIIERRAIREMLADYGVTEEVALERARQLRENGEAGVHDRISGRPFYYYYTTHLVEHPINIVIRKEKLI